MKKYSLFIVLLGLFVTSCEDFLETLWIRLLTSK